jgi:hypothetical protein
MPHAPQIMQYVELNPFARPECPQEAREAINQDQVRSTQACQTSPYAYCGRVLISLNFWVQQRVRGHQPGSCALGWPNPYDCK